MSDVDHLQELIGLPAVDFESGTAAVRPAADAVAWRIRVDPYEDEERTWEEEFNEFLDTVDPAGVRALIIGQWGSRTSRIPRTRSVSSSPPPTG